MDNKFLKAVSAQVRKQMKTFDIDGCRPSRKIEGFLGDDEIRGFKAVCIYVHVALHDRIEEISTILSTIDAFVFRQAHYNHLRYLMFFGADTASLVAPGPSNVHQAIAQKKWEGSLGLQLKPEYADAQAFIPCLHNGLPYTRFPDRHDLALFFCKGKDVVTTEEQQKRFGSIRRQSLWFFFGEDGTIEMEAGWNGVAAGAPHAR
ncbi:hypothetical protein GEOBRER4_n2792 [Citrifermentans bremense]|uniref:Uncharacterized protein n=1 Tax=Citrifermentans bremense TaxID=60035 RepID=A0A6S6M3G8_9BACT|nr:hypothetical protein [Citrifermentans bremense]BCG47939.1 hypothetical protein GEOBRER4_n2792 [Citrifermentans bremense]